MDAAKEWGVPPWELSDEGKVVWWLRWKVRRGFEISKLEQDRNLNG